MGDTVVAAVVAGVVSLVVTFGKAGWDERRKRQERRVAARASLDLYREPLLVAADDLGSRINNIRNDGFLLYLDVTEREHLARLGTLFRFAQFFAWTDILYGSFGRLRFENDRSTRAVADTLKAIGKALASDRFDRSDGADFTSTRLMLWRENQRAVGELMRAPGEPPRCVSFDSFVRDYDARHSKWFDAFASDLDTEATPASERFAVTQKLLAELVRELDVDGMLVQADADGVITTPRWARPSML